MIRQRNNLEQSISHRSSITEIRSRFKGFQMRENEAVKSMRSIKLIRMMIRGSDQKCFGLNTIRKKSEINTFTNEWGRGHLIDSWLQLNISSHIFIHLFFKIFLLQSKKKYFTFLVQIVSHSLITSVDLIINSSCRWMKICW